MASTSAHGRLIAAANRLVDTESLVRCIDGDISDAAEILDRNRDALDAAREALRDKPVVELLFETSDIEHLGARIGPLRNLTRFWEAESLLAAELGEIEIAARVALDIIDLSNAIRRGGLILDLLVAVIVGRLGLDLARQFRSRFDAATRWLLISELMRIEAEREPIETINTRDQEWEIRTEYVDTPVDVDTFPIEIPPDAELSPEEAENLRQHLRELLKSIAEMPKEEMADLHRNRDRIGLALLRMLRVDLAIRDWCETHGSPPASLESLRPALGNSPTMDPFTGEPFCYSTDSRKLKHSNSKRREDRFLLYSPGPNRKCTTTRFGSINEVLAGDADLCLDFADFEPSCDE